MILVLGYLLIGVAFVGWALSFHAHPKMRPAYLLVAAIWPLCAIYVIVQIVKVAREAVTR